MSGGYITKRTWVTLCDLCGKEITDEHDPHMTGSITTGYIAPPVTGRTRKAWLAWPPDIGRFRQKHPEIAAQREPRRYDFHAECIISLVEHNLFNKEEDQ